MVETFHKICKQSTRRLSSKKYKKKYVQDKKYEGKINKRRQLTRTMLSTVQNKVEITIRKYDKTINFCISLTMNKYNVLHHTFPCFFLRLPRRVSEKSTATVGRGTFPEKVFKKFKKIHYQAQKKSFVGFLNTFNIFPSM